MSPRISPLLMWKSTSFRATTPPNRSVTWSTSSRMSESVSGIRGHLLGLELTIGELPSPPSVGHQPLGTHDHDHDERDAEDERAVQRGALADGRDPAQSLRDVGQQEGTEDRSGHVARATDDDHGDEEERQVQLEAVRLHDPLLRREEQAREPTERRADGEGPQLVLEARHTHDLGSVLVLADGQPA